MIATRQDFTRLSFAKAYVRPALLIFLIPILSFFFFCHAESQYDARSREAIVQGLRSNPEMDPAERAAGIAFFTATPLSQLVTDDRIASNVDPRVRFYYATFRWMIRLSALSIGIGIGVFILAGMCVWFSLRSQRAQYWSLLISWHALRIYGTFQTIVLAALLLAMSFWGTALWFDFYSPYLIVAIVLPALYGVAAVIAAIFSRPKSDFIVEGTVLNKTLATPLWERLATICAHVDADPPAQVIAGIDDGFFVTEHPVIVNGKQYFGKTLFVSMALLKQLHCTEADAVIAHEMAHFSGQDTLYSKWISPLLLRYDTYLHELHSGIATRPLFYFMLCFRALFELSLSKMRREREFRADAIAVAITSPNDFAGALLRISAYSKFRNLVQMELLKREQAQETFSLPDQIEQGFPAYAVAFASDPDIGKITTAHPFDSHPPLAKRLSAFGFDLNEEKARDLLATQGDGGWRQNIPDVDELERLQWQAVEQRFRGFHDQSLLYRLLPETAEDRAIIERAFPKKVFESKAGVLSIDFEKIEFTSWPDPLYFHEFIQLAWDTGWLVIYNQRDGKRGRKFKVKKFAKKQQKEILITVQNYYGRHLAAVQHQGQIESPG